MKLTSKEVYLGTMSYWSVSCLSSAYTIFSPDFYLHKGRVSRPSLSFSSIFTIQHNFRNIRSVLSYSLHFFIRWSIIQLEVSKQSRYQIFNVMINFLQCFHELYQTTKFKTLNFADVKEIVNEIPRDQNGKTSKMNWTLWTVLCIPLYNSTSTIPFPFRGNTIANMSLHFWGAELAPLPGSYSVSLLEKVREKNVCTGKHRDIRGHKHFLLVRPSSNQPPT